MSVEFLRRDVFKKRHQKIRSFLDEENYEAYLVLTADNFYYVSGFFLDVQPWERPVAACIPKEGEPFLVLNELSTNHVEMAQNRGSLAIDDIHFWREHPSSTDRNYTRLQWNQLLASQLRDRGIERGAVVCDADPSSVEGITARIPKLEIRKESEILKQLRLVKSSEELQYIREGAKLTDYGQSVWKELVDAGELVSAVDAEATKQMLLKGADMFPGSKLECRVFSLSGPASASPHGTGGDSDMTFEEGHGVVNIIIVRLNGYVTENERTWFLGEPSTRQIDAFEAAAEATRAATEQMIEGNRVSSIDAAAQGVIEDAGFGDKICHRTGHGIGIAGHEYPDDVAFNHRPLMANEVWSAEPGIYIYGLGGFRHDDTVIVGKEESEVVTKWSLELEEQTIPV